MDVEQWQLHQDHYNDLRNILKMNGCIDQQGRIRKLVPYVWKQMVECGHTSFDFYACECRRD